MRPTLAVYGRAGRMVAISTPYGDNKFAQLHAKASAGELGDDAAAFSAKTSEMNPRVSSEFLEGERLQLGQGDFEREYEAVFGAGVGNFFEEDAVRAVVGDYRELPRESCSEWVIGFDPAFSRDPGSRGLRWVVGVRIGRGWLWGGFSGMCRRGRGGAGLGSRRLSGRS